jgi:hypothetical protein
LIRINAATSDRGLDMTHLRLSQREHREAIRPLKDQRVFLLSYPGKTQAILFNRHAATAIRDHFLLPRCHGWFQSSRSVRLSYF